ncbi:hypothetical protein JCM10296v2_004987 [Rhodotorula toruloides]
MSTVSDLTTSLSNVSLSRRSTTFTLVSSDGQRFDIDSAVLAFHYKVFADMFETVGLSEEADRTCDLAKDGVTVKAFLEALMEATPPRTQEAWLSVYSLMDKYECKALKTPLLLAGWSRVCRESIWAYVVGCHLGDIDLAWTALREVSNYTGLRSWGAVFDTLPQEPRSVFTTYFHERTEKARSILEYINFGKVCSCARDKDERDCDKGVWETVVLSVCSRLAVYGGEDVVARVREEIWSRVGQWGDCHRCGKKLHKKQQLADKTFSRLSAALNKA